MENLPQLFMRYDDLSVIPPFSLPEGISLCNHSDVTIEEWEELIEKAFGERFDFTVRVADADGYAPDHVLYLKKDGNLIATDTLLGMFNGDRTGNYWLNDA